MNQDKENKGNKIAQKSPAREVPPPPNQDSQGGTQTEKSSGSKDDPKEVWNMDNLRRMQEKKRKDREETRRE